MINIFIDYDFVKKNAFEETFLLFHKEHPELVLQLAEAIQRINEEIQHYGFLITDIEKKVRLGLIDKAITECEEEQKIFIDRVQLIRFDPIGSYRINSVNFGGGNVLANEYCFCLFIANLNIEIIARLVAFKENRSFPKASINYVKPGKDKNVKSWALYYIYASDSKEIAPLTKKQFHLLAKDCGCSENHLYQAYLKLNNQISRKNELMRVRTGRNVILFCISKLRESPYSKALQIAENEYNILFCN
ncbi:hypothetical protein L0663_04290 [Dyadobacter sp. CY107]|uniref:hypothetical protein n=1 Tax=Dyadobacter fanqingshengii TaxID=2906443 RepID=UPI001F2A27AF|nr:hypothetical protein [Dyadobacter fanqingshengii]MCF2502584.1 hypothetical protein [Dyadobacter fanqingshengii]